QGGGVGWRDLLAIAKAVDPNPWRDRLRQAMQRGDFKAFEGLAASADVSRLSPQDLALLWRALMWHRLGDGKFQFNFFPKFTFPGWTRTADFLLRAHQQYPDRHLLSTNLAYYCLFSIRQYDQAIRGFAAAAAVRPNNPYIALGMGAALSGKGLHGQ